MIDDEGLVHWIQCKICIVVEGKERLMVPKLDSLLKHARCWNCKVSKHKQKYIQYAFIFQLFSNEHPMINFEKIVVCFKF
jgi:hypothetical protein